MLERGRMVIHDLSCEAKNMGLRKGMAIADARAIFPTLCVLTAEEATIEQALRDLAVWCLRFTPIVAVDAPDGILLDISGCAHLWGGEQGYTAEIKNALQHKGYQVRIAIADTIAAAWGVARYGDETACIVEENGQYDALLHLPPAALRLDDHVLQQMSRLGFRHIRQFVDMPSGALRRRFGEDLLIRMAQALGEEEEYLSSIQPTQVYRKELQCVEPIRTRTAIAIALEQLLSSLCTQLYQDRKGARKVLFTAHRVDGKTQCIDIGLSRVSCHVAHLFALFEDKISRLRPGLGFEDMAIDALMVEDLGDTQEYLWQLQGKDDRVLAELIDSIAGKVGKKAIRTYAFHESHLPERSIQVNPTTDAMKASLWPTQMRHPLHVLSQPQPIEVMVPLPDYPPVHFRYQGKVYRVAKADGPDRIASEWWDKEMQPRDYYTVEVENGERYWLFRLGLYDGTMEGDPKWFVHGFFA